MKKKIEEDLRYESLNAEAKKFMIDASSVSEEEKKDLIEKELKVRLEGSGEVALELLTSVDAAKPLINLIVGYYNKVSSNAALSTKEFEKAVNEVIIAAGSVKAAYEAVRRGIEVDNVAYFNISTEKRAFTVHEVFEGHDGLELAFVTVSDSPLGKILYSHIMICQEDPLLISADASRIDLDEIEWIDCIEEIKALINEEEVRN